MGRLYTRLGGVLGTVAFLLSGGPACGGRHEEPGQVASVQLPSSLVETRTESQLGAAAGLVSDSGSTVLPARQIFFGDPHVHSTFSADAFWDSLPALRGEGPRPPAAACDFARFCAGLDFWALTDHAETLTPRHWRESIQSIRECDAAAGSQLVSFLGWEWTQGAMRGEQQHGHRTVLLRGIDAEALPSRPIAAPNRILASWREPEAFWRRLWWPLLDLRRARRYLDLATYRDELRDVPLCPGGREVRSLPPECHEIAADSWQLQQKLAQWGVESLVIPHATTSGRDGGGFGPLVAEIVNAAEQSPATRLFEVYSGRGSAEEYRPWRNELRDESGQPQCPEASAGYLPCCHQAGEIVRSRCAGVAASECQRRVEAAERDYLEAGSWGFRTVPDTTAEDWKDCGQCRDCFNPAFDYRPEGSAQFAIARVGFDDPAQPRRLRFGFVGASASHSARPGGGYKEVRRGLITDVSGPRDERWRKRLAGAAYAEAESMPPAGPASGKAEDRAGSFLRAGGLTAVHAEGRDRGAIWAALQRREVYATSGDRILLWFELLNGPEGRQPMGAEASLASNPIFQVRAIGAAEELPGCSTALTGSLTPERLAELCAGECHHPGTQRRVITRIEVIRIRPQQYAGEPIEPLIEDPWRRIACPADPAGCFVELSDPEFVVGGRDAVYYVRAIQEPTPAINAGGLRCEANGSDPCVKIQPCYVDDRTDADDDCLGINEERAWSSPIYVQFAP